MSGYTKWLNRSFIIILLFILFTSLTVGVKAKTVIKAGEDKTVIVDDELEFHGTGEGEYYWDFDESVDVDGDKIFTNDKEKTGKTVSHKYTKSGTYIVTLTIVQEGGNITRKSTITVEDEPLFDPWLLGLVLVVIGIVMFLFEAASPGFFIGIPATILIVIGIFGILLPDLLFTIWSPIVAVAIGIPVTYGVIQLYKRIAPPKPPTTTVAESLIGKRGIVIVDTDPDSLTKGKVKVGSDVWSATSARKIKKGKRVEIVKSEGVHITVKEVKE